MPLRRLTRFSKLELEKEKDELERTIEALDAILGDDDAAAEGRLRRAGRGRQDLRHARVVPSCSSRPAPPVTAAAAPLEVADDPCFAYLSSSGLLARTSDDEPPGDGGGRANHDVIVSAVRTTARGEVGVLTSRGRVVKLGVLDLPAAAGLGQPPATSRAALPFGEFLPLEAGERALALTSLRTDGPGLALGTRAGRGQAGQPGGARPRRVGGDRAQGRRRGRRRRRAAHRRRGALLHHHRRPAAALRRRRRAPAGPLRRRHGRHQARRRASGSAWFGALDPAASRRRHRVRLLDGAARHRGRRGQGDAVHASTPARAAPPAASAATGSSRARTPWSSPGPAPRPARAAAASGAPVDLPEATGRRDGSGVPGCPADRRRAPVPPVAPRSVDDA